MADEDKQNMDMYVICPLLYPYIICLHCSLSKYYDSLSFLNV